MVIEGKTIQLFYDKINLEIIKTLIRSEMSVTALSQKFNIPLATMWRKIKKLEKEGLIEVTKKEKIRNLEVKYYRASAVYYIEKNPIQFEPRDPMLAKAIQLYRMLSQKVIELENQKNEIPKGVDPIDYSIALDLYANINIMLDDDNRNLLKTIESIAENFINNT